VYRLTGPGYVAPRVVQMFIGILSALLAFVIVSRWLDRRVGVIVAGLMAVYWAFIYFEGEFLEPSVSVLLVLLLLLAAERWFVDRRPRTMLFVGLAIGALALVRPNALVWIPVIGLWAGRVVGGKPWRRIAPAVVALVVGAAVVILPVTARNYAVGRDVVLISSNAGVNMYIGNNDRADGQVRGTMPGIGNLDTSFDYPAIVTDVERLTGRQMKHSEVSGYLAKRALQWVGTHPAAALRLLWWKTLLFWGPAEPADNKVVSIDRSRSSVLRSIPLSFSLVLALAVAGGVLLLSSRHGLPREKTSVPVDGHRRRELGVLAVWLVLAWYASHLPFAVTARYRIPIIPILFMFGGYYIATVWRALTARQVRWLTGWVAAVIGLAAVMSISLAPPTADEEARWHYQRGIAAMRGGRLEQAAAEYRAALKLYPAYTAVYNDMAALLASQGRVAESIPYFREAVELVPDDPSLLFNLALALEMTGATEESHSYYRRAVRLRPGDPGARAGLERTAPGQTSDGPAGP
jgi:4-amino-4-deoxy-L-arabinose transferase-like glycosyltransferase